MSLKWVGSQGLGKKPRHRRGFLGCIREKNSPMLCFTAWRGVFSKGSGRGVGQTSRGPVLARSRAGRLEPFSCVPKRAGRGRENKPRLTLGGCRLARLLGTTRPVPGGKAQPAIPRDPTPDWAGLGQFHNFFLGL